MNLYRVQNINCPLDHDEHYLRGRVAREIGVGPVNLAEFRIERRSIDARDKRDIRIVYTIVAGLESPSRSLGAKAKAILSDKQYRFPSPVGRRASGDNARPIIVGAGPAGLFCALMLAEAGYRPLVLERGDNVQARAKAVAAFWNGGELDPESNIQFGEGGAGTWSDGKLNTTVSDEAGRNRRVLEEFVAAGAPREILYSSKPHIGTDYLVKVVANLRGKIESLGGELRFRSRVKSLEITGSRVSGVELDSGERLRGPAVVLAVGHSARDTFAELARTGIPMERKPFAIGLRVEHRQEMISRAQYGERWKHPSLGAADYKLTHKTTDGRAVYSFCMCPGGWIVDASSERGLSACNGMSDFGRSSPSANSAIVVAVRPDDYGGDDSSAAGVMAGVEFQRRWERLGWEAAREAAGFAAGSGRSALPLQSFGGFSSGTSAAGTGRVNPPGIRGSWVPVDLNACLPGFVSAGIKEAMAAFDHKIHGFAEPDVILAGMETRTSSPVRILRSDSLESSTGGLFPCGEGAGYAGGIMSAAIDGIRVAEAVALSCSQVIS